MFLLDLLLACLVNVIVIKSENCNPVSLEDVKIAAFASDAIYKYDFVPGHKVPGTSFVVQKVIKPLLYSVPLAAIVATYENTTVVCFKGTKSTVQLLQEFRAVLHPTKRLYYGNKFVRVLSYFWYAMISFRPNSLISKPNNKTKYIFTGHSLGGAIASLLALDMKERHKEVWENPNSSLITFGEPRVGNKEYARVHDRLIPANRKLRFVYGKDIVPHIPPKPFFYHHSREIWIWKKLCHFWRWKWNTYWTACPKGDLASSCSNNLAIKTAFSHSIKNYVKSIVSQPDGYYDRFKTKHNSFREALCS